MKTIKLLSRYDAICDTKMIEANIYSNEKSINRKRQLENLTVTAVSGILSKDIVIIYTYYYQVT